MVTIGDGYGYGYGYSDGSGYGDGYGYGYGFSDGYGSGVGGARYWRAVAEAAGGTHVYRSRADGTPANGGTCTIAAVGAVHTSPTAVLCRAGLHATLEPEMWKGDRWWIVRLSGGVTGDANKAVGRRREFIAEIGGEGNQ